VFVKGVVSGGKSWESQRVSAYASALVMMDSKCNSAEDGYSHPSHKNHLGTDNGAAGWKLVLALLFHKPQMCPLLLSMIAALAWRLGNSLDLDVVVNRWIRYKEVQIVFRSPNTMEGVEHQEVVHGGETLRALDCCQ